jgi:tetratricopeptide (TPR) repeat protein
MIGNLMVRVFLSHSSKDKPFARDLANALEAGGYITVWFDEHEINYGDNSVLKMEEGLDADAVLLILSPDSVESNWVKEEWTDAFWDQTNTARIKLAPVLHRDCRIPHFLRNKKPFDLRTNQTEGFRAIRTWLLGLRPAPPPVVHLPQRPPLFIGREPEIETFRTRLKDPGSIAFISAIAGSGKTTLALEYAHRHQRDYESVHWLPCQKERSLAQIAGELAWQLGLKLEGDLETIVRELNGHCARKRCLLVFDNVEDDTPASLLPGAGRASVLLTTRRTTLPFLRGYQPVKLPLFTEEQCFELFGKEIGEKEVEKHRPEARALFQRLEYLPIGIAVTASLIREDVRYTIAGMAKNLPANVTALLREAVAALSPQAQTLLTAMAACAPEGFRLGLAAQIAELDETSSLDALQEIHSRSLAEELDRDERRYRLHALVRKAAGSTDLQRRKHAELVRNEFEGGETNWRQCEKDMADRQAAFAWLLDHTEDDETWWMAKGMAYAGYELTRRLGRLPEAYEICERTIEEANRRNDPTTLQAWYGNQALILRAWGRLEEAMALRKKEEEIGLELGDQDGLSRCYGNQAVIQQIWGRLEEAMALHKNQEAICEELGNKDGLQASYGNQALILNSWGRLEEAMALHKKEEAISEELGNRDGLQASYGNQALILQSWGRLEEAMALHKKQEAISEELGNKDGLQRSYGNQALILKSWGRLEEAMALLKKQEAISEELGNKDGLQRSYGNQALILVSWDRLEEGMELLQKKEAICLELSTPRELAYCYWGWGLLARKQGDRKTEKAKLGRALALFTELGMSRQIEAVQAELDETNRNT